MSAFLACISSWWPPALLGLEPHPSKLWAGATTRQGLVTSLASGCQEVGRRMGLLWFVQWEAGLGSALPSVPTPHPHAPTHIMSDSFQGRRDLGWGPNHCLPTLSPVLDGDPALIDWGVPELSVPRGQGPSPGRPLRHPHHLAQRRALSRCSVFVDSLLPPQAVFSPCPCDKGYLGGQTSETHCPGTRLRPGTRATPQRPSPRPISQSSENCEQGTEEGKKWD